MNLYLAGSSKDAKRVAYIAKRASAIGATLVGSWWDRDAIHGTPDEWTGNDATLSLEMQRHLARGHMRHIDSADVFWLLFPSNGLRSTCFDEFGFAMARRGEHMRVIVTGSACADDTWTSMADYRDVDDLCGLAEVCKLAIAKRRARIGGRP